MVAAGPYNSLNLGLSPAANPPSAPISTPTGCDAGHVPCAVLLRRCSACRRAAYRRCAAPDGWAGLRPEWRGSRRSLRHHPIACRQVRRSSPTWPTSTPPTSATGHFELVEDGAHIWTEGTSSTDKVAGYVLAPGAKIGSSFAVNYTATTGTIPPGAQIKLSDGSTLVGEAVRERPLGLADTPAAAYAPQTGGGFGSSKHGSPAEWQAAIESQGVTVAAVGFSLGSGVLGDGVLTSVTAGCHTITFDTPPDYTPVAPTRLFDTRPGTPPALRRSPSRR